MDRRHPCGVSRYRLDAACRRRLALHVIGGGVIAIARQLLRPRRLVVCCRGPVPPKANTEISGEARSNSNPSHPHAKVKTDART